MPAEPAGPSAGISVGVSPFRDIRGVSESVLGKRTIPSGQENDLVVQGTVAGIVTSIVKKSLIAHGSMVKDALPWDLAAEGIIKTDGTALRIGGEVKALWLESTATSIKTHVKATVQLRIVAADAVERKIIRSIDVSSTIDQDILYSQERLESALSEAVSSAIDQIFIDDALRKRLQ
jgi:hypothetical protein